MGVEAKQEEKVGPAISITKKTRQYQENCLALVPRTSPIPENHFFQSQTFWLLPVLSVHSTFPRQS